MITQKVSAVVRLRDGFTGRLLEGKNALCRINGLPCRPLHKPGGYLIWSNLSAGEYQFSISLHGFRLEETTLTIPFQGYWEGDIYLKPGVNYPHAKNGVTVHLLLRRAGQPLSDAAVWVAPSDEPPLKIAQEKVETEEQKLRVFYKGTAAQLPIPGYFIVADDEKSELVQIQSIQQEEAQLSAPFLQSHGRGKALLPAQSYHTDTAGNLCLMVQKEKSFAVFCEKTVLYFTSRSNIQQPCVLSF